MNTQEESEMETKTYTNRRTEVRVIEHLTDGSVRYEGGYGHGMFPSMKGRVAVGDSVLVETRGFSYVSGVIKDGEWLFRKSDEDFERQRLEYIEESRKRAEAELEKHRDEWQARTDALPIWIKRRIERFQENENFARDGWGYELNIAELAVIYAEHGPNDSSMDTGVYVANKKHPAWAYAEQHGTSGNQHDFAKMLARAHVEEQMDLYGSIGGLSPITGDAFYSGEE